MAHFFTFTPRKRAASDIDFIHLIENTGMKILVATEKPFAKKAVDGIRQIVEGAGYELALLEKYTDKSEYLTALHNHTLPVLLNTEKVEKGDCFFIPAGTVHAICKGCYIAEIQQTSDITYRIYDYDRRDKNGNPRELHTELATDVINFCEQKQHSIHYHQHENHTEELVSCNYFTTNYLKFDKEVEKGNFTLVYDVDKTVKVNKGETILVPAILKNLFLIPETEAEILEIYIR